MNPRKYKVQRQQRSIARAICPISAMCSAIVAYPLFSILAWSGNNVRADIVVVNLVRRQQSVGARAGRIQERRQRLEHGILLTTKKTATP
jgi:membrane protein YdbS with pleckstrin-like domain